MLIFLFAGDFAGFKVKKLKIGEKCRTERKMTSHLEEKSK